MILGGRHLDDLSTLFLKVVINNAELVSACSLCDTTICNSYKALLFRRNMRSSSKLLKNSFYYRFTWSTHVRLR
jgi:hypothetical protein